MIVKIIHYQGILPLTIMCFYFDLHCEGINVEVAIRGVKRVQILVRLGQINLTQ
jgi:hypothetical protein